MARRSEVEPSEPSEQASEGEAGQGSHISALVRTRAPAETSQGENLFDSPLRALIHWRIPYLATCSLPSSSLPSLYPFMYTYLPLSLCLLLFLPRLCYLLFLPFFLLGLPKYGRYLRQFFQVFSSISLLLF